MYSVMYSLMSHGCPGLPGPGRPCDEQPEALHVGRTHGAFTGDRAIDADLHAIGAGLRVLEALQLLPAERPPRFPQLTEPIETLLARGSPGSGGINSGCTQCNKMVETRSTNSPNLVPKWSETSPLTNTICSTNPISERAPSFPKCWRLTAIRQPCVSTSWKRGARPSERMFRIQAARGYT